MNALLLSHVSSSWYRVLADGCFTGFLECRLALPILTLNQLHESPEWIKPFRQVKKNYSIIWIMVKPKSVTANSGSRETLVSRTFFSTLEYAAVPYSAIDLFISLVEQLHGDWSDLYTAAEEHLSDMVSTLTDFIPTSWLRGSSGPGS